MGGTMSSDGSNADPNLQRFVESEAQQNQVRRCATSDFFRRKQHLRRTKKLFSGPEFNGVTVKIHELNSMDNGSEIQRTLASMTGQSTVPSVWVNGKFVGGNAETQAAYKGGTLLEMLGHSS
eukprot:scaffold24012_cov186-Cylindrotheca_fusiformis.AAC.9